MRTMSTGWINAVRACVRSWRSIAYVLFALILSPAFISMSHAAALPRGVAATCVGDCDDSGTVTVDELVKGVRIALGALPLAQCARFDCNNDGQVTIGCLITAVSASLKGCASQPSPTRSIDTETPAAATPT